MTCLPQDFSAFFKVVLSETDSAWVCSEEKERTNKEKYAFYYSGAQIQHEKNTKTTFSDLGPPTVVSVDCRV